MRTLLLQEITCTEKLMVVDRMVIVELHLIIAAITQLVVNVLLWWSKLCIGSAIGAQRVIMVNLYPQDFSDMCLYVC